MERPIRVVNEVVVDTDEIRRIIVEIYPGGCVARAHVVADLIIGDYGVLAVM